MLNFLKYVLATLVGLFLFFVLGFILLVGLGALFSPEDVVTLKDKTVLRLDLDRPILEKVDENPFVEIFSPFTGEVAAVGVRDLKTALKRAANDDKIAGIDLRAGRPSAGWAILEEVREALEEFKSSGKFIHAFAEGYTEKGYYLASVADVIYLPSMGDFEWNGFSVEYDFYKGTLDKLEIKPLVFRVGEYKSAVEPFLRTNMSEESRLQMKELVEGVTNHYLNKVSTSRGIPVTRLNDWADSISIEKAEDAHARNLITHVGYHDDFERELKVKLDIEESKKVNYVGLTRYLKTKAPKETGDFNKRVAVVIADGQIVSGEVADGVISSGQLIKELKKVRENDKVKAVVLRINSPGGSALASDLIWKEVKLTAQKKPVIASMGDLAASGGYYIAMGCDTIVAQPNTLTGSIGIFGLMLNMEPFMRNKLGITFDRVKSHEHSDWPSPFREMSEYEKRKIQNAVEYGYEVFTSKAAEGRKMELEDLKKVASGRVWTGEAAKEKGLVDVLGGLDDAIELAAQSAGLEKDDYRVRFYPEKKDWKQEMIKSLTGGGDDEETIAKMLGPLAPYAKAYQHLMRMEGVQALLPYDIRIN